MIRRRAPFYLGLLVAVASACGGTDNGRPPAQVKDPVQVDTGSKPVLCSVTNDFEFKTIQDFEIGATTGGWYFNNDLCDKCQKVIDRIKELNSIMTVSSDGQVTLKPIELDYSKEFVLADKRGCNIWELMQQPTEASEAYKERTAPIVAEYTAELATLERQLIEGDPANNVPANCRDACNASQTPNAYIKPLTAASIEFKTNGKTFTQQPRCGSRFAMHVQGGPFQTWGGAFAVQLGNPGLDATGWDGISFWARVGPSSRHPLRIEISDWQNDDKQMMYLDPIAGTWVKVTRETLITRDSDSNKIVENHFDSPGDAKSWCNSGIYICNSDSVREDKNGCDKYGANRSMSGDWQFFSIDFSEFRQSGWGMPVTTPPMDPNGLPAEIDKSQLRSLNFLWTTGVWDVWIDDIALFRRKQ